MIDLTKRSDIKELLDGEDIPFADIRQNMQELNTVNNLLGGHAITVSGVRKLISEFATKPLRHKGARRPYSGSEEFLPSVQSVKPACRQGRSVRDPLSICEIGCGGGDNLAAISKWCSRHDIIAHLTGIDIKKECIDFAKQQYHRLDATWITSDYQTVKFERKPDIIFSSLFCHHFSDAAIVSMLKWMQSNSNTGFFINDLHRHPAAYYSIKMLSRIFSRSYLLKNDAPLSVARGFNKKEWISIFERAGITNYSIRWKWAFRYLIVCKHE